MMPDNGLLSGTGSQASEGPGPAAACPEHHVVRVRQPVASTETRVDEMRSSEPRLKRLIRSWSPPAIWSSARHLKSLLAHKPEPTPAGGARRWSPGFHGPFSSWDEAELNADGWDSIEITEKTFRAALKVRDGEAEFEQDTILHNQIHYSPTILAFLLLHVSTRRHHIDLVDFGGSLGTNYFQSRKLLRHMSGLPVSWRIVERPTIANLGRAHFANSELSFFTTLDEALRDSPTDAFLFSGSLQYVRQPADLVSQVIARGARLIAFDRVLTSPTRAHAVFIQAPDPRCYYASTYPVWRFSTDLLVESLDRQGFGLVEHFTLTPDAEFHQSGMLFSRRS